MENTTNHRSGGLSDLQEFVVFFHSFPSKPAAERQRVIAEIKAMADEADGAAKADLARMAEIFEQLGRGTV